MFDDPKKELQRLQGKLLAVEQTEWEVPEVDADTALAEVKEMLAHDREEDNTVPEETEEAEPPVPEKKGHFTGLLLALLLETLVLVGLVAWWLLWR